MSGREFLVESGPDGLRAALIVDRRLYALEIDRTARPTRVGMATRAKAVRNRHGMGTIVQLPDGGEMLYDGGRTVIPPESGHMVIVQVVRDPRGDKTGTASRTVSLTGRAVVHLPFEMGISASRRLSISEAQRRALESRLARHSGGWILRRGAASVADADLIAEAATLAADGKRLRETDCVIGAPDAFRRLASDYGIPRPDRILVSGRAAERSVTGWLQAFAPSLLPLIALYNELSSLFDVTDLDTVIAMLAEPRVILAGGGSIVIERTEALTAIDVNAGGEPNVLNVNLTAAVEIARQLRLRHIGGIVVIDFISMGRPRDEERTVTALKTALAEDAERTQVLPVSALGLVEMTRERRGPGVEFQT